MKVTMISNALRVFRTITKGLVKELEDLKIIEVETIQTTVFLKD